MPLVISAEFRFGFYQGRDSSGAPERYPSPARLHAALVSAAHGRVAGHELDERTLSALTWFEQHAPDAVSLPESILSRPDARSYRDKGLVAKDKVKGALAAKKDSELATRVSALAGPVRWWWQATPDQESLAVLHEIAAEVAYLGEAASQVRLCVDEGAQYPEDSHRRIPVRRLGDTSPTFLVAAPGRYEHLQEAYSRLISAKPPSERGDAYSTSEVERADATVIAGVRTEAYEPPTPKTPDAPWPRGIRLHVRTRHGEPWSPASEEYVRWCVVLHRALVRFIGDDAPAVVTGKYLAPGREAVHRPANRLAIQIIPPLPGEVDEGFGFLLMIPRDADPVEVEQIRSAARRLQTLFRNRQQELHVVEADDESMDIDLTRFWHEPPPGTMRWWMPTPTMIAEGGPSRRVQSRWTAEDAIRLAVAFVWRDQFGAHGGPAARRNVDLAAGAAARGVRAPSARRDVALNPPDFAHRVAETQTITCVSGQLSLGDLASARQLVAIGQSRHLGGGLLWPVDLPIAALGGASAVTQ